MGLKAKPTKPVTEVLRPVVAKYGLHLADLVARIVSSFLTLSNGRWETEIVWNDLQFVYIVMQSGELEPLDLGLPISNLDGLRVVLDIADHAPGKGRKHTDLIVTILIITKSL